MEIPVLISAIAALCGVIAYLYRRLERVQHGLESDLRAANEEIKRLRG